ncbi:MAG: CAP domain-containing protein [Desulfomonilaceae bacterium]
MFPQFWLFALSCVFISIPTFALDRNLKEKIPSTRVARQADAHVQTRQFQPDIQSLILKWTNRERSIRRIPLLKISGPLNKLAYAHSLNQARAGTMGHNSDKFPQGWRTFGQRIAKLHFSGPASYGENIFWSSAKLPSTIAGLDQYCRKVVQEWMDSPGHRKNILSVKFRLMGLGYCDGYMTQLFASQGP